jgi:hypothetical protein
MRYDMYFYEPCPNCKGDETIACLDHKDNIKVIPANIYSHYISLTPIEKYKFIHTLMNLDFPE